MVGRGHDPFICNCIGRDPEQDAEFRGQGGKAAHSPSSWSSSSVGWHLSGRAIDVKLPGGAYSDRPQSAERTQFHKDLTELAEALGWKGIAAQGEYDDWHFDFKGPWAHMGYREGALASLLDVGGWRGSRWEWRAVQAQLWRLLIDVGGIDGSPGDKTYGGLEQAGLPRDGKPEALLPALYEMEPSSGLV
jgi:hypothetical protein